MPVKRKAQNRGLQIKPRIIRLFEEGTWEEGDPEKLKYFGHESDNCSEFVCI